MTRMTGARLVITGVLVATCCLVLAIQASAETNDRAVVHDWRGQPVYTESTGTCVRTKWLDNHDECRRGEVSQNTIVQRRASISRDERTVYFPFNVATLTPEAMTRLDTLATDIKSQNDVKGARVVGFADRIGTPSYNEALSKRRAENVKNYLVSKGILTARVAETRWFGASMPATSCPHDLSRPALIECLQKDRRVEVEIDYRSEVVADQR
jgi:outer membrane protein OmpA-like peptidoglycan-associated protein